MEYEIVTFNNASFGDIRTVVIDNATWFAGKDVADALGYKNSRDALANHVDAEDKTVLQRSSVATLENHIPKEVLPIEFVRADIPNRGLTIINESGLYALVLSSKLPSAKEFKHWVTSEVLPSIRKTGNYHQPKGKELLALALVEANEMLTTLEKENQDLKLDIAHKTEKIIDLTPKAIFADRIADSKGTVSVRDLALILTDNGYKISSPELFRWLREKGYIYKKSPKAKQKYISDGLFKLRTSVTPDGYNIFSSTRVTGKGMKYFLEKFLPNKTEYKYTLEVK